MSVRSFLDVFASSEDNPLQSTIGIGDLLRIIYDYSRDSYVWNRTLRLSVPFTGVIPFSGASSIRPSAFVVDDKRQSIIVCSDRHFTVHRLSDGAFVRSIPHGTKEWYPCSIALGKTDIFVADQKSDMIRVFDRRTYAPIRQFSSGRCFSMNVDKDKVFVSGTERWLNVFDAHSGQHHSYAVNGLCSSNVTFCLDRGDVFVADSSNHCVTCFARDVEIRRYQKDDTFYPHSIAIHWDRLFVADFVNHQIDIFDRFTGKVVHTILCEDWRPLNIAVFGDQLLVDDACSNSIHVLQWM